MTRKLSGKDSWCKLEASRLWELVRRNSLSGITCQSLLISIIIHLVKWRVAWEDETPLLSLEVEERKDATRLADTTSGFYSLWSLYCFWRAVIKVRRGVPHAAYLTETLPWFGLWGQDICTTSFPMNYMLSSNCTSWSYNSNPYLKSSWKLSSIFKKHEFCSDRNRRGIKSSIIIEFWQLW